jgi:hypothetical protein
VRAARSVAVGKPLMQRWVRTEINNEFRMRRASAIVKLFLVSLFAKV